MTVHPPGLSPGQVAGPLVPSLFTFQPAEPSYLSGGRAPPWHGPKGSSGGSVGCSCVNASRTLGPVQPAALRRKWDPAWALPTGEGQGPGSRRRPAWSGLLWCSGPSCLCLPLCVSRQGAAPLLNLRTRLRSTEQGSPLCPSSVLSAGPGVFLRGQGQGSKGPSGAQSAPPRRRAHKCCGLLCCGGLFFPDLGWSCFSRPWLGGAPGSLGPASPARQPGGPAAGSQTVWFSASRGCLGRGSGVVG